MAKMMKLVQNEYIKTMKKISTLIMFILIAVFIVGYVGLSKISSKLIESEMFYSEPDIDYSYEIKDAEEMKYEGYELDIEKYNFAEENEISPASWKYNAMNEIFAYYVSPETGKAEYTYSESDREEIKKYIIEDDWKSYCEKIIDVMKSSGLGEEEYWEYQCRIDYDIAPPNSYEEMGYWENAVISSIAEAKFKLAELDPDSPGDNAQKKKCEDIITLGMYRLDNDVEVNVADTANIANSEVVTANTLGFWTVFASSASLIQFIGLILIVIAGSSLANEFSQGTIKFLLINPVKRWKILMSKYIMSISLGYILLIALYIVSALLCMIFFGTSNINAEYLQVVDGAVTGYSGFLYVLKNYLLSSVNVIVMTTLAFTIASLVKSASLAIGVSLFAMLSGGTLVTILKMAFNQDWARFLIFANTDLSAVANGTTGFSNHSMAFAVGVVVVHLIVFFLIAWDGFTKREI